MNFEYSSEELHFQENWRKLASELVAPFTEEMDSSGKFSNDLLCGFQKNKLLLPFLLDQAGKPDNLLLPLTIALEEIARFSTVAAFIIAQQTILGVWATGRFANMPEKNEIVRKAADFEMIFSLAATEDEAGCDLAGISTTCRRTDGGKIEISGAKAYANWAKRATYICVFAKTRENEGTKTSLCLVPGNCPGLTIEPIQSTMGLGGLEASSIKMDKVLIPAENVIGVYGFGSEAFEQISSELRVAYSAAATGLAQQAFDDAVAHAKSRKQFGKPVGSFQSLQWRFADAAMRIDASRLHVWRAVAAVSQKGVFPSAAAMAKIISSESAFAVADFAVQVLGGKAFVKPNRVERLFRDSRFLKICYGTSEILRNIIGDQL